MINTLYKMRLEDYLFRRKNIKDLIKITGVKDESDLEFTIFNVEDFPPEICSMYMGDDFEDFSFFRNLKEKHNLEPEVYKQDLDYFEDSL